MNKKKKDEMAQVAYGQGKEDKKKGIMVSHKGAKKVMLAQKQMFVGYPSRSSLSFQDISSRCPQDLSLVIEQR